MHHLPISIYPSNMVDKLLSVVSCVGHLWPHPQRSLRIHTTYKGFMSVSALSVATPRWLLFAHLSELNAITRFKQTFTATYPFVHEQHYSKEDLWKTQCSQYGGRSCRSSVLKLRRHSGKYEIIGTLDNFFLSLQQMLLFTSGFFTSQ